MDTVKILEVKQSIFASNDEQAAALRKELKEKKVFLLNLMSAPGSGKTTTLRRTIAALKDELRIGVMEADIDSDVDARAIAETGAKAIQLHTGGMCHLDAEMTRQGLAGLGEEGLDLVVLENVGNLVCPAEFDTGAVKNAMILSVPEGHDKPLKYPLMFQVCDVVLVNKIDVLPYFDFDLEKVTEFAHRRNPDMKIFPISAKTGMGLENLLEMVTLTAEMLELKANPNRRGKGTVIEARLDKTRGPIATLLVQNGTLRQGDIIIAGTAVGRVRVMTNDKGRTVKTAGPSQPVEITGLADVPTPGDEFDAVTDERMARELVEQRRQA
ncbi:MAG: hydrogenase accessory protein HypB, partial [Subdoligranulum sp.]|nr:hydrogenase accessory protein HypB [Subdoligranulum sp.]